MWYWNMPIQARYKETNGIEILTDKEVAIRKVKRKVYKVQKIKRKYNTPKDIFRYIYESKV